MDLLTLSHADLIALVLQQQALIAQLEATVAAQVGTIARLEARIRELEGGSGTPRGMPGHKPEQSAPGARRPRHHPSHFSDRVDCGRSGETSVIDAMFARPNSSST